MLDLKTRLYYGSWMFFGIFLFIQKLYNPGFYTSLWFFIKTGFITLGEFLLFTLACLAFCLVVYMAFKVAILLNQLRKWFIFKKQQAIEDKKQAEIRLQHLAELKREKLRKARKKLKQNKIYAEQIQIEKEVKLKRQNKSSKSIYDEAINDFL